MVEEGRRLVSPPIAFIPVVTNVEGLEMFPVLGIESTGLPVQAFTNIEDSPPRELPYPLPCRGSLEYELREIWRVGSRSEPKQVAHLRGEGFYDVVWKGAGYGRQVGDFTFLPRILVT